MFVDRKRLPLNNFVQETIGNIMAGFSKTRKVLDDAPELIEEKIRRLASSSELTPTFTLEELAHDFSELVQCCAHRDKGD